jgi:hypothetical protein
MRSGVTAACRDSYIDLGWTALGLLTGGAAGLGKLGTAVVGGASGWTDEEETSGLRCSGPSGQRVVEGCA